MYQAALIFCKKFNLPVECRYLSCSRYSLRLPLFHRDLEEALQYVCRGGIDVTYDKILRRAGLTVSERNTVIALLSPAVDPQKPLSYPMLSPVQKQLRNCPLFIESMNRHSREALPAMAGYLEQEGLLDKVADAIVDSGWVGSIQKSLNEALRLLGREQKIPGYYWGLYDLPADVEQNEYHCYYFEPRRHLKEKVYFNNCLFEAIFTAPHGMTLRYRQDGNRYVPVYGQIDACRKAWIKRMESILMQYVELLAEQYHKADFYHCCSQQDRKIIYQLLKQFMGAPSREEAEAFGSLPFSDDVLEGEERQIAAPLSSNELRSNHMFHKLLVMSGLKNGTVRESAWFEGSAVRNGKNVEQHLRHHALYQAIRFAKKMYRF